MIVDILLRLPSKSLCRFRCISKQWSNLMLDTKIVKPYHDKYWKENLPLLIYHDLSPRESPSICMNLDEEWFPERRSIVKGTHCLIMMDANSRVCDKFELSLEGYGDVIVIPPGHELVCLKRGKGVYFFL
jgi:hypothetical protein